MSNDLDTIRRRIRARMAYQGITALGLAQSVGVHHATILRMLKGNADIKLSTFIDICNACQISPRDILDE